MIGNITWKDRVANLTKALGRDPTLNELMDVAQIHIMMKEEIEEQRQSFIRGMTARCEHGELDFEQCCKCRGGK
jgi:hypothetical protein